MENRSAMRVVIQKDGLTVLTREISDQVLYLGRSKKNEIVLADASVSRRHAKLFVIERRLYLEDLKSVNGTLLGGERIRRAELKEGDSFAVGPFEVKVEASGSEDPRTTELADQDADTTFAEATTDTAPPENTLSPPATPSPTKPVAGPEPVSSSTPGTDDFFEAIAVRPQSQEPKALKAFLKSAPKAAEPTPAQLLPVERSARLVRLDGPDAGTSVPLNKPEVTIGRANENDVVVRDEEVSSAQAAIENTGDGFVIKDKKDSTGTFVDGVPVRTRELENHDVVQVGRAQFEYVEGASRSRAERPRVMERSPIAGSVPRIRLPIKLPPFLKDWRLLPILGVAFAFLVIWFLSPPQPQRKPMPAPPSTPAQPQASEEERDRLVRHNLKRAHELIEQKKYDEAESRLNNILEKVAPGQPDASALLSDLTGRRLKAETEARARREEREASAGLGQAPKTKKGAQRGSPKLKKLYQEGVMKFESGDLVGAEKALRTVAAQLNMYQDSAKKLLAEIGTQDEAIVKRKMAAVHVTDDPNDLLASYAELKKITSAHPENLEAAQMKKKVTDSLETKARKAYMDGITFLEVVEDRPSALERFVEALRLSPDPKSLYRAKAQKKVNELKSGTDNP
ncbi:MAG: FHA domain-containing protein [Pseudomonadota bacterium]